MEITKEVKPFIRRGANTFGNIVYIYIYPVTTSGTHLTSCVRFLERYFRQITKLKGLFLCLNMFGNEVLIESQ